jgi:hypothetical protein
MEIAQGGQGHIGHQNIESEHQQFQQPLLHIIRFLQCQKMHKSLVPFDNLLSFSKLPMDLFFMLALHQAQICPVFPPNPPNHLHPILWHWLTSGEHPGCWPKKPSLLNRTVRVTRSRASHFLKAWHLAYLLYPSQVKILCKTLHRGDRRH